MASGPGPGSGGPANAANPSLPPPPGAPAGFAERQPDAQQERRVGSPVNALSIARNAVAATEAIARAVASESARMSYSEKANPSDGIGLNLEGTGIKLGSLGLSFGGQTMSTQQENSSSLTFFGSSNQASTFSSDSVQEQRNVARVDNQNANQGQDIPTIPQQNNSGNFENKQSSLTALQDQRVDSNETVKNKGDVSELAGGIDLTKLTIAPPGYNAYLAMAIKDSPFYEIKEVYKNQINVDNVRALRQMSSDRLHQQLINLQYK
jgi:hypothetical protein